MTKEALHDGIIMTISSPGHAGDNVVFFQYTLEIFRCINRTSLLFGLSLLILMSLSLISVFMIR